jgi:hypothetical protein
MFQALGLRSTNTARTSGLPANLYGAGPNNTIAGGPVYWDDEGLRIRFTALILCARPRASRLTGDICTGPVMAVRLHDASHFCNEAQNVFPIEGRDKPLFQPKQTLSQRLRRLNPVSLDRLHLPVEVWKAGEHGLGLAS